MTKIQEIKSFKSRKLGTYKLSENEEAFGCIFLNSQKGWEQMKNNFFNFNAHDLKHKNTLNPLNQIVSQNLYKLDYIIIKLQSVNSTIAFFINRTPIVIDTEKGITDVFITNFDLIGYEGKPDFNAEYEMSYILNEPSKEVDVPNTFVSTSDPVYGARYTPDIIPHIPGKKKKTKKITKVKAIKEKSILSYLTDLLE